MPTTYDVRIWNIEVFTGKATTSYRVWWRVGRQRFKQRYKTKALADSFRSELMTAARKGEPFDVDTGLPVSMGSGVREMSWYEFACAYMDMKWGPAAATYRRSISEALTAITPALFDTDQGRPDGAVIRKALHRWAFNTGRREDPNMPADVRAALRWVGAALRSRLRSLMVGAKGATLASARVPARDLFSQPCVIELRNLGDDEEKAFVMALLLCQLYEFAESRMTAGSGAGENLQHLTLIEEAHRLLRAGRAAGAETADAQAKAVAMFTDMLAEMRSYGEGFVVADQIPTKLAPEILKNSNVKILHRLVAPDDRAVAAASANLDDSQARQLGNLQPGTAIVHDDRNSAAVLVRMEPLSDADRAPLPADTPTRVPEMTYLHRNSGCRSCPAPCTFLEPGRRISSEDALDAALAPIFSVVLAGGAVTAWSAFTEWRTRWMTDAQTRVPSVANAGGLSCAFTQSAHRWLGRRLAERAEVTGATGTEGSSLLVQSRCARLASRLSATWREVEVASAAELPDAAAQAFTATHQGWAEALHTPPREMPGCPDCPSRCTTFGAVSELPREARDAIAARATADMSPGLLARSLISLPQPALRSALDALPDDVHRARYLYCGVTTATANSKVVPVALLDELRSASR